MRMQHGGNNGKRRKKSNYLLYRLRRVSVTVDAAASTTCLFFWANASRHPDAENMNFIAYVTDANFEELLLVGMGITLSVFMNFF